MLAKVHCDNTPNPLLTSPPAGAVVRWYRLVVSSCCVLMWCLGGAAPLRQFALKKTKYETNKSAK